MKLIFVAFTFLALFELSLGSITPNEVKGIISTAISVQDIGNPDFNLKEHSNGILRTVPLTKADEWQASFDGEKVVDGLAYHFWEAVSKYTNLTFKVK